MVMYRVRVVRMQVVEVAAPDPETAGRRAVDLVEAAPCPVILCEVESATEAPAGDGQGGAWASPVENERGC